MRTMRAAIVAALLAGTLMVAGQAALAQDPGRSPAMGAVDGSACMTAMDEMMAMMREHMGAPMMGEGRDMGPGMMGSDPAAGMMDAVAAPSPAPATSDEAGSDAHATHHPAGAASVASGEAVGATTIAVSLTDGLTIEPEVMRVPVGVPVTFVVTNVGVVPHEFVIGDEATQLAHETTMGGRATMDHDEPTAIGLAPGETKELTLTFAEPGELLAGCHIPGHYPAGMRAVISVG